MRLVVYNNGKGLSRSVNGARHTVCNTVHLVGAGGGLYNIIWHLNLIVLNKNNLKSTLILKYKDTWCIFRVVVYRNVVIIISSAKMKNIELSRSTEYTVHTTECTLA